MPKTRNTAATAVAQAFLPLERNADETAAFAYRFVALLMEQRAAAKLPPLAGNDAIELVRAGAAHAAMARESFMKAHTALASLMVEVGVDPVAFGDSDECKPTGHLAAAPVSERIRLVG